MSLSNFEHMLQLASEVFDAHNDPQQLDIDEHVIERLKKLHPATVSEYEDGKGPVVWILLIPTTREIMNRFLNREISEQELLDLTPTNTSLTCIYLCSAMVLPEYRGKGIAKRMTLEAIESIRKTHPIDTLYVWAFSKEGAELAGSIARASGLPISERQ
jgi:GNAT superfamily N-acetyltransferase